MIDSHNSPNYLISIPVLSDPVSSVDEARSCSSLPKMSDTGVIIEISQVHVEMLRAMEQDGGEPTKTNVLHSFPR